MTRLPLEESIRSALAAMLRDSTDPDTLLDRAEEEILSMFGTLREEEHIEIVRAVRAAIEEARAARR